MYSLTEVYKIGRGPSSSHSMGPEYATNDFLKRYPSAFRYEVTLYGSLAMTGKGHLTDFAIMSVFKNRKAEVKFDPDKQDLPHPNTMTFMAYSEGEMSLCSAKQGRKRARIRSAISASGRDTVTIKKYRFMNPYTVLSRLFGNILKRFG